MIKFKFIEQKLAKILMILATALVLLSFFGILYVIAQKGLPALNWDMVTKIPDGGFYIGKEGGVLNAILGSFYIATGSSVIAFFLSLPIVLYINLYLKKNHWFGILTRISFDVLFGIPSIVYGAFGFTIMMYFGMKASLLGGLIACTLLVLPIMVRTMDEVILTIPKELIDAALSLGATSFETVGIILRQSTAGILTAFLLAFARGIGDVASVMFTAGFSDNIPTSIHDPAATLPLAVFFQLSSPLEEVQARAYASALLLTIIVLTVSILSRFFSKYYIKNKI